LILLFYDSIYNEPMIMTKSQDLEYKYNN